MQITNKPKEPEIPSEEEKKQELLKALEQESLSILSLAYYYAKGYELGAENVTIAWENTIRQTDALNRAYQKGFSDCLERIRKAKEDESKEKNGIRKSGLCGS